MNIRLKIWVMAVAVMVCGIARGEEVVGIAEMADSSYVAVPQGDELRFRPTQLILPGALIAVGALGVGNGWMRHIDRDVRDGLQKMSGGHRIKADEYLRFVPAAGYLALGSIGVECRHNFVERALVTATSTAAYGVITGGLKLCINERRPGDSDEYNSFPSGHTAIAFMGAELARSEYPLGVGIGAYTVACGVAFLRLYNDRHWLNDVIAGAGVGILCARIGYWMLPVWRRVFNLERRGCKTAIAFMPFYDGLNRGGGASFVSYF